MKFKDRLYLILKFSHFTTFLMISLIYAVLFGGAFSLNDIMTSETPIQSFLISAGASGGGYFLFFTVAIIGIYVGVSTKAFLSLSMPRKIICKLWSELCLILSTTNTLISLVIIFFVRSLGQTNFFIMGFNMGDLSAADYLLLFVIFEILWMCLFQLISLIANIGNKYGAMISISSSALMLASLFLTLIPILRFIAWGEFRLLILISIFVLDLILIFINKYMLNHVEVKR